MLGKRDPQGRLDSAIVVLGKDVIEKMGLYGKLATEGVRLFRDEDFAGMYCLNKGRLSIPPSLLAIARLLQHYEGISDLQVVEKCRYDLRWKVALHLDVTSIKAPFAKSTFQEFRTRLTLREMEGLAFEKSILQAKEVGLLPGNLHVAFDSSPVRGRGAVKDTYNLLSDAIVAIIRAVAGERELEVEDVAGEAGLARHLAPSIKGTENVDWNDKESVGIFLGGLLEDCKRAVSVAENITAAKEAVELLRKVIADDIDDDPEDGGKPRIRKGVAKERTVSVQDPEMRHGHKSSGHKFNGHKAHIAVERTTGVITAVSLTAPSTADGALVKNLVEQTENTTDLNVEHGVGDCAYGSQTGIEQAGAVGIELVTKMPGAPTTRLGAAQFRVSDDRRTATCPAGVPSERIERNRETLVHVWSASKCGTCPLKTRCTDANQRSLRVAPYFHDRRRRESYARSTVGRQILRERVVVEHAIGRLKNLGAGMARYFGRVKTQAQWMWTAAVVNLSLVWSRPAIASET